MAVLMVLLSEDYSDDLENSPSIPTEECDVDDPASQDNSASELALKTPLETWESDNHIQFSKCDQLFKIVHPYHLSLPLSTRTLVKTPRTAVTLKTILPLNILVLQSEFWVLC